MVGYCQRFAAGRRFMKSLIERGALGDPVQVSGIKCVSAYPGWWSDPNKGGGPLRFVGVHITDQVLWMLGGEPERVYAAEVVREKLLCHTRAEIPFSTAVVVDQFEEPGEEGILRLYCSIVVEHGYDGLMDYL